jgi:amino acid transporter
LRSQSSSSLLESLPPLVVGGALSLALWRVGDDCWAPLLAHLFTAIGYTGRLPADFSLGTIISALLVTRFVVQFMGQIAALMWLRQHRPQMERPFRMWLYPLPCIIALAGWLFLLSTMPLAVKLYGALALAVGVLAWIAWDGKNHHPADEQQPLNFRD